MRCETCRFWEHLGESFLGEMKELVDAGNCKRYPQYINKARTDWCGEWKKKLPSKERMMPGDPIPMTEDQVKMPTSVSTVVCYVCGHTVFDNGMLSSEGWIHAKCAKDAAEGSRWIKGLDCDTEDRTGVATDSGSGQLSSVRLPTR